MDFDFDDPDEFEPLPALLDLSDEAAYGAASLDPLATALGGLAGRGLGELAQDPQVRTLALEAAETCRDRAKTGVSEWITENRQDLLLVAGAAVGVLLVGHFILSVFALRLAFPRRAFIDAARGADRRPPL